MRPPYSSVIGFMIWMPCLQHYAMSTAASGTNLDWCLSADTHHSKPVSYPGQRRS